jgi:long-chain acyl-CoA synthetase
MNLAHLLHRAGRAHRDRWAVAEGTQDILRYGELSQRVAMLAGALLHTFELRQGDRVALAMGNCREYVELVFAIWHAGLTAVPINAKLHPREFAYILEHSAARICLVTPDLEQAVSGVRGVRIIGVPSADYQRLLQGESIPAAPVDPMDVAWLFYTSGTTGRPKGAMLTHRNLLCMTICYFADVDRIDAGDGILHAAPMSHGSGTYILPHVAQAAKQIIPSSGGFDPQEIFQLIAHHQGVSMFAAPTMVRRLVDHPLAGNTDLRRLKTIVYGGGPMYVEDCKRALSVLGYKLAQIYGQGESPMTITALSKARHAEVDHPRYEQRLASVGMAHTAVEVRVADADDQALEPGAIGEVLVRGDTVMRGYWADEAASEAALRNGWLHTGDMGSLDADGFLTLKDRSKDLIISGGSNIYPREVEEVLLRHPSVQEVSIVGEPHADWGEAVVAFVVARPGHHTDETGLDQFCLDHIARFKRPKRYVFVDALPKNNYGKVLKTELRKKLTPSTG